ALKDFDTLMGLTNAARDGLDWPGATQMIIDGTAGYNVKGDWALAATNDEDVKSGEGFADLTTPDKDGTVDFQADSFTMPVDVPHPDGSKAWLETIGSAEGQEAFNKVKGSIPARTDIDAEEFSDYQQSAMKSYEEDEIVPSLEHGAAAPVGV